MVKVNGKFDTLIGLNKIVFHNFDMLSDFTNEIKDIYMVAEGQNYELSGDDINTFLDEARFVSSNTAKHLSSYDNVAIRGIITNFMHTKQQNNQKIKYDKTTFNVESDDKKYTVNVLWVVDFSSLLLTNFSDNEFTIILPAITLGETRESYIDLMCAYLSMHIKMTNNINILEGTEAGRKARLIYQCLLASYMHEADGEDYIKYFNNLTLVVYMDTEFLNLIEYLFTVLCE